MVKTLYGCCKHAFAPCSEEPRDLYIGVGDDRKRPDVAVSISVKSTPFVNHVLDLTVVSPFLGVGKGELEVPSDARVLEPDKRANDAAEAKNKKYSEISANAGLKFVPFVMYTTGKLHKDAENILELLAEQASERRHIPAGIIKNYYMKLLSVCLVNRIGYAISIKVSGWQSNNLDLAEAYRFGNERAEEIGDTRFD